MNKFNPPTELPLLLGRKIEAPKPAPVTVVELKSFLFLDKLTGRMSYSPPTPPTEVVIEESTPIKPAPTGTIVWHEEDPPKIGWYVATREGSRPLTRARYWDGSGEWSYYRGVGKVLAGGVAVPASRSDHDDIVWAYRLEV